ncbi:MAG: EAL domain-containing protein [Pseudomonadota bacterium]
MSQAARCRFSLALDDFGTAHASIATILDAPISVLKIDRIFVPEIDRDSWLQCITLPIIAMAQQLGLEPLAERVEGAEEIAFLERLGCHKFQGFHIAAPMPAPQVCTWLSLRHAPEACTG